MKAVVLILALLVCVAFAADAGRAHHNKRASRHRRHLVGEKAETQAPAAANSIASAATAAILGSLSSPVLDDQPLNIPVPLFARSVKCSGCLATTVAVAGDSGTKSAAPGDAQAAALNALCAKVDSNYAPACQFLSQQAAFIVKRLGKNDTPLEVCAALTFCDLGDAGILQSAFTPLRGDTF
eukprot:gnl/Hemi2/3887_TR1366_c0_g2_i1.p1 gnl/Hemi2/3887_TR1366_c0_g2~~gnl/Hemi2/3887_TR1366_c0_g2_i1.p1  ORF type:complete len:195 (+),score=93.19 gnl/Hemi2/3887_TR1366_c0_g2_i1:42-587(+)